MYVVDSVSMRLPVMTMFRLVRVQLPSPYGRGSSTLKTWIENNQRKDAQQVPNGGSSSAAVASVDDANKVIEFPAHWGEPPLRQTRDMCVSFQSSNPALPSIFSTVSKGWATLT